MIFGHPETVSIYGQYDGVGAIEGTLIEDWLRPFVGRMIRLRCWTDGFNPAFDLQVRVVVLEVGHNGDCVVDLEYDKFEVAIEVKGGEEVHTEATLTHEEAITIVGNFGSRFTLD